ncbi:putative enzyme related to lactoylglutathione lyase [Actinokineospora baliensis]|uniref:VOC family protein n=1 Tax=Actinokineospora baliensis TaxID=547056 RepID=UPI001956384C|nr:VOC family protein [Actinokineospora baliensis]MBM7774547.1 putative enzyme related to lactoylglutathione lyase [Actinokineospora baliensis]
MGAPRLGSILLGSADPDRLRQWYRDAFAPAEDEHGFLDFGETAILIDPRDDVTAANPQPGRYVLNFHVDDAAATAAHLDTLGVTWLVRPQSRPDGIFGTLVDPDGNYLQIIELSAAYLASRR